MHAQYIACMRTLCYTYLYKEEPTMPYRLREKMSDIHYFDIVDDLIMNFVNKHIDTPCTSCPDRDETSALCDMCAVNKYRNGKESYKYDPNTGACQ